MIKLVLIIFFIISNYSMAQIGKVTVYVYDEQTNVLENANVSAGYGTMEKAWHRGQPNEFEKKTDKKGRCTLTGHGNAGEVLIYVTKKGYYRSSENFFFKGRLGLGKLATWKPWNPEFKFYLTKIDNPIPMYAKRVNDEDIPALNKRVCYDLRKGDWVYDGCQGRHSDIFFCLKDLPPKKVEDNYYITQTTYHRALSISFPNKYDGIISVKIPDYKDRGMRMSKVAPDAGYTNLFKETMYNNFTTFDRTEHFFIRVNTKTNAFGKITSANYGKIYDDFHFTPLNNEIDFTYYLNPTPNDRNVECDISTNLIFNLPKDERPWKP